jgi:hypothetical protein
MGVVVHEALESRGCLNGNMLRRFDFQGALDSVSRSNQRVNFAAVIGTPVIALQVQPSVLEKFLAFF